MRAEAFDLRLLATLAQGRFPALAHLELWLGRIAYGCGATARELALLANHLVRTYPGLYKAFALREFTWNKIKQGNGNLLLGTYPGADGLKTGHTAESGYGMVASALVEDGIDTLAPSLEP